MPIFHTNFKSSDPRPSRPGNSQRFMGADGAGIAAVIGGVVSGQLTSLTMNVGGDGFAGPYPVGTRRTVKAICRGASGRITTVRVRNVLDTVTDISIAAWLQGIVDPSGALPLVAVAGGVFIPGTTDPIVAVTVTVNGLT